MSLGFISLSYDDDVDDSDVGDDGESDAAAPFACVCGALVQKYFTLLIILHPQPYSNSAGTAD